MKLTIDPDADALYLTFGEAKIVETEEVAPGVILDYGANDTLVGIELLSLSNRMPGVDIRRLSFEILEASNSRTELDLPRPAQPDYANPA